MRCRGLPNGFLDSFAGTLSRIRSLTTSYVDNNPRQKLGGKVKSGLLGSESRLAEMDSGGENDSRVYRVRGTTTLPPALITLGHG